MLRPQAKVLQVAGAPATPLGRALAICLSIGDQAAITGWAALWLYGLRKALPRKVEVAVPRQHDPRPRSGAIIHRCSWLLTKDLEIRHGLTVTRLAPTLVILARSADEHFLQGLMLHARQQRLLKLADLWDVLGRARNAPGTAKLRRLCDQLDGTDADSKLEVIFRDRWAATPWPQPWKDTLKIETPRHSVTLDVPWPDYLTGVDCHGRASTTSSGRWMMTLAGTTTSRRPTGRCSRRRGAGSRVETGRAWSKRSLTCWTCRRAVSASLLCDRPRRDGD